jgi:hypothetical protein
MLAGTSGATYVDPKTEKTGINIKMQILNYLTPFRFLKDEGEKFSIREWVREEDDSWVFITTKEEQKKLLSQSFHCGSVPLSRQQCHCLQSIKNECGYVLMKCRPYRKWMI